MFGLGKSSKSYKAVLKSQSKINHPAGKKISQSAEVKKQQAKAAAAAAEAAARAAKAAKQARDAAKKKKDGGK